MDPYYKQLSPKFGFAYQVSDKMVMRGGYGINNTPTISNGFGFGGTTGFNGTISRNSATPAASVRRRSGDLPARPLSRLHAPPCRTRTRSCRTGRGSRIRRRIPAGCPMCRTGTSASSTNCRQAHGPGSQLRRQQGHAPAVLRVRFHEPGDLKRAGARQSLRDRGRRPRASRSRSPDLRGRCCRRCVRTRSTRESARRFRRSGLSLLQLAAGPGDAADAEGTARCWRHIRSRRPSTGG